MGMVIRLSWPVPGKFWSRKVQVPACHPCPRPGMEVAAYLTEKAHSVSVVELEETPFRRFLGERVGRALMKVSPLQHAPSALEPWGPAWPLAGVSSTAHLPTCPDRCLRTTG